MIKVMALMILVLSHLSVSDASSTSPSPPPSQLCAVIMPGEATLSFCGSSGISCCDAVDDAALREQFEDMNISDTVCAGIVKAILCEKCSPWVTPAPPFNTDDSTTAMARSAALLCAAPPSSTSVQHPTRPLQQADVICLERIAAGSYLSMAAHPDGSGRVFLSSQDGMIWLASVPTHGSGGVLLVDDPFLDLTDRVRYDAAQGLGLMGVAFHPEFASNGRFFVSYTCDSGSLGGCGSAAARKGTRPCQYQLIVAEFSAKGGVNSKATQANPSEVRRVFTLGLPQPRASYQQHGGQILISPSDGYLYLITGHGGDKAHGQIDFSQNKTSVLGKIIRFNIDLMAGETGQTKSYGNISTPNMEIFAMGLSNPRGCSFDSERSDHLYCANIDKQQYERVYLISTAAKDRTSSGMAIVSLIIDHDRPADNSTPSILGGLVYGGSEEPTLNGRYVYMYGSTAWVAVKTPEISRGFTVNRIPRIRCSRRTPLPCPGGGGIGGRVLSLGEDNNKAAFFIATDGIYRVVASGLCDARPPSSSGSAWMWSFMVSAVLFLIYLLWPYMFPSERQPTTTCNGCFSCCASIMCCNTVISNHVEGPSASQEGRV